MQAMRRTQEATRRAFAAGEDLRLYPQRHAVVGYGEIRQALFHLLMGNQSVMGEMVGNEDGVLVRDLGTESEETDASDASAG